MLSLSSSPFLGLDVVDGRHGRENHGKQDENHTEVFIDSLVFHVSSAPR